MKIRCDKIIFQASELRRIPLAPEAITGATTAEWGG